MISAHPQVFTANFFVPIGNFILASSPKKWMGNRGTIRRNEVLLKRKRGISTIELYQLTWKQRKLPLSLIDILGLTNS